MAHTGETSEERGYEGIDMMIEIKVKTMDSQTHNLRISNQRRVRNLKEDIALLIGMPIEQQRLIYRGKHSKDDQVISSCNVQHGDTLHLVCNIPGMSSNGASHSTGTDGVSSGTHRNFERDQHQNLNVDDPRVRHRTMQTIQTMFDYVVRVVMQVHMRQVEIQHHFQYDLYLARLHPRENSARSLRQTRSSFSVEDLTESFPNRASQYHHERTVARENLWSQLDALPIFNFPVEFNTATPGASIENVTENIGTGVSSGPSTVEYRSAHDSSIECLCNLPTKIIRNSIQQDDVAQSQLKIKQQKME